MATRTCKKCGWEVDRRSPLRSCPICSTKYEEGYCSLCGAYCTGSDYVKHAYCRECYNEVFGAPTRARQRKEFRDYNIDTYGVWADKIAMVRADYPTLTEEQWLNACKHFGGCAICGSKHITTRGYFIPYHEGGRYCDWNVIPLCDGCSIKWQTLIKVYNRLTPFSNYLQLNNGKQVLKRIMDYLEVKLDAAKYR